MEKVAYNTDFFSSVKDYFQNRKKRELDDYNDEERVSVFNYIKESSDGKCKASVSKRENEITKKRGKRNIMSTHRKQFSSDFVREKRRAEQELLELQHKYMRCNKNAGQNAPEACEEIYLRFQKLVKEINEKFHQFNYDNFDELSSMESDAKKIKRKELNSPYQSKEVKPSKEAGQVPNLQKNNEHVGQTFFGDGFYSYTYDQIPKFHEDLHGTFDSKRRNLKTMSREGLLPFQNQGRPETSIVKEDQGKNIPVKVPDPTGEK